MRTYLESAPKFFLSTALVAFADLLFEVFYSEKLLNMLSAKVATDSIVMRSIYGKVGADISFSTFAEKMIFGWREIE